MVNIVMGWDIKGRELEIAHFLCFSFTIFGGINVYVIMCFPCLGYNVGGYR